MKDIRALIVLRSGPGLGAQISVSYRLATVTHATQRFPIAYLRELATAFLLCYRLYVPKDQSLIGLYHIRVRTRSSREARSKTVARLPHLCPPVTPFAPLIVKICATGGPGVGA